MLRNILSLSTCLILIGCIEINGKRTFRAAVTQSETRSFEVLNATDKTMTDIYVTVENLDSRETFFLVIDGCAQTHTLEVGQSCQIGVLFAPFDPGLKSGRISVAYNGNSFHSVLITGDAYANSSPVAQAQTVTTSEDTSANILLAGTDSDGDTLSYEILEQPSNGTLGGIGTANIAYIPTANFNGEDNFTFRVGDGMSFSEPATVQISVHAVNDAPVALSQNITVAENVTTAIMLSASEVESTTLTYTVVSGPSHGTLSGTGSSLLYTPTNNYHGPDSFTFMASDGILDSNLAVVSLQVGDRVLSLAYGSYHICALIEGSTIKCWGDNNDGQLGMGDTFNRSHEAAKIVNLGTGLTATAIAARTNYSCALFSNGRVKCWGSNFKGQLGLGDTNDRGDNPGEMGDSLPYVDLGTGVTATAIAAGGFHACALLSNSRIKCWGFNQYGQLGMGVTANRGDNPGEMGNSLFHVDLGTGVTVTAVAAGLYFSCALLTNGGVKCWGSNTVGQLGLGDTIDRGDNPGEMGNSLPYVNLGTGVTASTISAGDYCASSSLSNGEVKRWGSVYCTWLW